MRINSQGPSALQNQTQAPANPAQQAFHELKHMVMKLGKALEKAPQVKDAETLLAEIYRQRKTAGAVA